MLEDTFNEEVEDDEEADDFLGGEGMYDEDEDDDVDNF